MAVGSHHGKPYKTILCHSVEVLTTEVLQLLPNIKDQMIAISTMLPEIMLKKTCSFYLPILTLLPKLALLEGLSRVAPTLLCLMDTLISYVNKRHVALLTLAPCCTCSCRPRSDPICRPLHPSQKSRERGPFVFTFYASEIKGELLKKLFCCFGVLNKKDLQLIEFKWILHL